MPDLHFTTATATPEERAALDAFFEDVDERRRDLLLPALHALNDRAGWISPGGLNELCDRLQVPPAEGYGVATFYAMFATSPRPPAVLHVCDDIACQMAGAEDLCAALERTCGEPGKPAADGRITWLRSPCLGLCERAPAALLIEAGEMPVHRAVAPLDAPAIPALLSSRSYAARDGALTPHVGGTSLRLLQRVGKVDPQDIDAYRAHGGYRALRRALELGPDRIIREVVASKLLGRGGAAFPTGRKMEAVAKEPVRPHYLICNADESEPGTFKDRLLMEYDPFAVIEAMTIAAAATGCEYGYVYIRGEYPLATARIENAVRQARTRGFLGDNIFGKGIRFDIEVRRGAGAYICGEETALFNSIEGKRGEPRNKPPFPAQFGVFGKPTLANNVETLACIPHIILEGGAAFAQIGTEGSTGPKLFCLSGCVEEPGLYEVPFWTTLGELISLGGGVRAGKKLRTVLLGGAAGSFVGADALSMPLTFEATRAAGTTLGSGVVMVFDETVDLGKTLHRIAAFFRDESCGQCVPCRVGTVRQEEALHRIA
ncbi:MAG: NAD(P)H-dependent oxidoreductase subunit E, partial [Vulcanimicrobiaceae bacterium]